MVNQKLCHVTNRFLNISIDFLGVILLDESLPKAVRKQKAVFEIFPNSKVSRGFLELGRMVYQWPSPSPVKGIVQFFLKRLLNPEEPKTFKTNRFGGEIE